MRVNKARSSFCSVVLVVSGGGNLFSNTGWCIVKNLVHSKKQQQNQNRIFVVDHEAALSTSRDAETSESNADQVLEDAFSPAASELEQQAVGEQGQVVPATFDETKQWMQYNYYKQYLPVEENYPQDFYSARRPTTAELLDFSCSGNVTDISTPSFVVPPWKILVQHSLRLQGLVDNLDAFVHTEIGKSNLDQQSETLALLLPERWGLTAYDADLALRTRRVTGRWAPFLKNLYCPPGRLQAFQDRDRNQDLLLDKAEQVEWGCPVSADTNKDGFLDGIEWGKHCDRENEIKGSGPAKDHDVAATIPGSSIASQATPNTTATRGSRRDYDVNYDENTDSGLLDAI
ncbi:unnamed protein product, partial [Amoebophrya sp. A120]|eukprot:GSA120T00011054001.1